jgi:hypothetical protein
MVGSSGGAPGAAGRKRLQFAGTHVRNRLNQRAKIDVRLPRHDVDQCGKTSLVYDDQHLQSGEVVKQFGAEVRVPARSGQRKLARVGLAEGEHFPHRIDRQRRTDGEQARAEPQCPNPGEARCEA